MDSSRTRVVTQSCNRIVFDPLIEISRGKTHTTHARLSFWGLAFLRLFHTDPTSFMITTAKSFLSRQFLLNNVPE